MSKGEDQKPEAGKKKNIRVHFELNIPQTEAAKAVDVEAHGVASINILAKRLFLEHMEKDRRMREEAN